MEYVAAVFATTKGMETVYGGARPRAIGYTCGVNAESELVTDTFVTGFDV